MTTTMPTLHVGRGTYVGGVTVFPVWSAGPAVDDLDTGATPWVTVAERSSAPVVAELVVTNEGPRPVVMLEGELLEGGWQHRALAHDLVLAPGAARVVEVVCVEQGRWSPSAGHARGGRRASPSVRSSLHGPATGRQGAVWSRVARYGDVLTPSPTGSLVDHLDRQPDDVPLATPMPGQRGVVIGVGGQPLVLELFGSAEALAAHLAQLLRSVLLDAAVVPLHHVAEVPSRRARRMIARLDVLNPHHPVLATA